MGNQDSVSAIVLAGGASMRMGETNKLLAKINGITLVNRAVKIATSSNAAETIVVTGHESELVRESLSEYSVNFVYNPNYQSGLSTSLKSGISAVSRNIAGAVVLLGDMPWLMIETVNELIEHFHTKEAKDICRPTFKGLAGNPVLWPRNFFPEMMSIQGDIGAKRLIERNYKKVSNVEVNDAGILIDINKPDDLNLI